MSDKLRAAAKAALDAMKLARGDHGKIMLAYPAIESWLYHRVDQRLDDAIKAVEDALAEPKQEPMLEMNPEKRPWVGLTDKEIDEIYKEHHNQYGKCESVDFGYERAIEAKLREKNSE